MAITYRGVTLEFGKHSGEVTQRGTKLISFPGVNGTFEMDMGKRQRRFVVTGRLTDLLAGSLTPAIFESWNDTSVGDLIVHGVTYSNIRARATWGNVLKDAVTDKMTADYSIEFRQLRN